jgi:hypothetical protein
MQIADYSQQTRHQPPPDRGRVTGIGGGWWFEGQRWHEARESNPDLHPKEIFKVDIARCNLQIH